MDAPSADPPAPPPAARFDIESPPASPKANAPEAAAASAALATISLDSPKADDVSSPFGLAAQGTLSPLPSSSLPRSTQASEAGGGLGNTSNSAFSAITAAELSSAAVVPAAPAPAAAAQPPAGAIAAPKLPKASHVKVVVKDAEKVAEKSKLGLPGSHISCLVHTECKRDCALAAAAAGDDTSSSSNQLQVFEVRRRFDDFEVLSRLLKAHYRGYFVPRLPPSDWLSGGDIKTRRVDLQDYLSQVSNHPVLQRSEELLLFLTEPGDLAACSRWRSVLQRPAPLDALLDGHTDTTSSSSDNSTTAASTSAAAAAGQGSAAAGAAASGWKMMSRMKHSLMSVVQQSKAQPELSAEEQQLRQAKDRLKELQQHLSVCVAVVRKLVGNMDALGEDYGELGRALSHFARLEEGLAARQGHYTTGGASSVQLGADLQRLGYGALRQHSLSKQYMVSAGASLVVLPDYHALVPECVAVLEEREDALVTVNVLAEQLRDKQEAAAKMAAALGPAADTDKRMVALNAAMHALQDKLVAAEQQYKVLKQRNQAEVERLNLQQADDFRRALGRFAALQAQAAAAAADVWSGVAEQFADHQAAGSTSTA